MQSAHARIATGLLLLTALWVGVYWWWPTEPPVSFANTSPAAARSAEPPTESPATGPSPTLAPSEPPDSPPPPPPVAVIPPEFLDHVVQGDETFETISARYFGTTRHAEAIARSNPLMDPKRLKVGRLVRVPRDPTNIQGVPTTPRAPQAARDEQANQYVVKKGDTLSGIAKALYGDPRLATLIYEANRDQLPDQDSLREGQRLRVPPKGEDRP